MTAILEEIENQAMKLSPKERGDLIHRLILSLEAGRTQWTPADEVMTRLRTKISAAKAGAGQS